MNLWMPSDEEDLIWGQEKRELIEEFGPEEEDWLRGMDKLRGALMDWVKAILQAILLWLIAATLLTGLCALVLWLGGAIGGS